MLTGERHWIARLPSLSSRCKVFFYFISQRLCLRDQKIFSTGLDEAEMRNTGKEKRKKNIIHAVYNVLCLYVMMIHFFFSLQIDLPDVYFVLDIATCRIDTHFSLLYILTSLNLKIIIWQLLSREWEGQNKVSSFAFAH